MLDLYYSSNWQVLEEDVFSPAIGTSATADQYVWGQAYVDEMVLRDDDSALDATNIDYGTSTSGLNEREYVLQDANWNTTGLVDFGSDSLKENFIYDPYGNATVLNAGAGAGMADAYNWIYLHQGGRFDPVTGLILHEHRDYGPGLGRWYEQEPSGAKYVDGLNLYQTEDDNPVNETDSDGLMIPPRRLPCWPHCRWIPTPPPWNVPPGPACNTYGCATCPPLKFICNNAGAGPWANCVRGCLLANWNPATCSYNTNIAIIHADCWNTCANAFGHIGPP
jgi:RHS repeat-associated protein